jgi:Zn-dependent M28 family amino/carboxypeptidase
LRSCAGSGCDRSCSAQSSSTAFCASADVEAGTVTNVVAGLPGTASTGAVALNAHFDSGPGGPGASDCAACVASVFKIARALRAGPRLRNDVVVVFSDGEEKGDLGAAAFAGQSPLMRGIDVVFNSDVSGSHGPGVCAGR